MITKYPFAPISIQAETPRRTDRHAL